MTYTRAMPSSLRYVRISNFRVSVPTRKQSYSGSRPNSWMESETLKINRMNRRSQMMYGIRQMQKNNFVADLSMLGKEAAIRKIEDSIISIETVTAEIELEYLGGFRYRARLVRTFPSVPSFRSTNRIGNVIFRDISPISPEKILRESKRRLEEHAKELLKQKKLKENPRINNDSGRNRDQNLNDFKGSYHDTPIGDFPDAGKDRDSFYA